MMEANLHTFQSDIIIHRKVKWVGFDSRFFMYAIV